ncbi:MAG: nitronate monooxygenase [Bdellovibrionota bacterium]
METDILNTTLTKQLKIKYPIICGAMYPCSNPELIAAVSKAGGIGVVQPLSTIFVYQHDFRASLKLIKNITNNPFGMNVLIEKASQKYEDRMKRWVDIAIEEGCRFFVTALGNPKWVVEKVKAVDGFVYHNVTEHKWAEKAVAGGVDGFICINNRAGGHAGTLSQAELIDELADFKLPMVAAGGIGNETDFISALKLGYQGIQMGTRFIASYECAAHQDYKNAVVKAKAADIILTERVTGIPLSVIKTPHVEKVGTKIGPISRLLFKHPLTKKWMRTFYNLLSFWKMKKSAVRGMTTKDYYQAGKSSDSINEIEACSKIIERFVTKAKELDE